jgi:hypothetical protein
LNLETLTTNQTVKPIEQVEVFTMQGSSALTLSANDVLSLGGANASTMSAYAFASTTGGSGTTSSTGKVQMVVNGTASDVLDLTMLNLDGVTTNGVVGNTGLAGAWSFMGTTTIGSTTYKVYNHSTTQAQVLVNPNVTVNLENPIAFTSMTKDSGTLNADWTTADGSAGRLVSGVLGVPLLAGQTVEVYSGTTLIGTAQVAANGTSWAITDTTAYNANWSYTAKIMSGGSAVSTATQAVTLDNSEAAPVISAVVDSASATIANNGTSTNSLTTVSGTGLAGDVLYLYDNSSNNLVGTTVVGSNGTWSISGLQIPAGSNTFAARQVDAAGNQSVLSNLYVVNSAATNLISNGDLSQGNTGFTSTITNVLTSAQRMATTNNYAVESIASGQPANIATATTPTLTSPANYAYGTWTKDYITGTTWGNPDGSMAGNVLTGNLATATPQTVWATSVNVVAGKTYTFTFDYALNAVNGPNMILWLDNQGIEFQEAGYESGHFTATYTATETQSINLSLRAGNSTDGASGGDFWLDNFVFRPSAVASDNTLTAAGTPPATPGNDGVSTPLNYASGILDALAGNDLITANSSLVANLAAGGRIMGGAGVDTLKLAANTSLNLEAFTRNQTVTPIQEVEIFQLQGGSTLTLSANDVLSLGGANLSGYSFAGSAGKVQLVVNATNTDTVNLTTLSNDGVTVNGSVGNTGLDGSWSYAGITSIGGSSYKVYNHSTTQAQVLVLNASVNVPSYTQAVTIDFAQADTKSRVEDFNVLTSGTVDTASTTGAIETDSWSVAGYWGPSTGASAGTLMASSVGVFVGTTGVAGVDAGLGTDNYLRIGNSGWTATTRALDTVFTSKTGEFNSIAFKMGDLNYQSSTPAVVTFYDAANNVVATVNWYVGNTYDTFSYDLGSKTATKFKVSTTTGDAWFMDELTTTLNSSNALASGASIMDATPRLTGSFSDPLGVGDVIKIYEGSRYLGEATVDAVTKTWYFQLPSMEIGSHTYNAVINSGSGALPVNSGNFTLNLLATPLVLDLDGDGIETTTLAAGVVFDLDANGTAERAAWVAGGDGLLVRDLDGNGLITSGAELFGSGTTLANGAKALDGFAALAGLDSNGDGIINASDAAFGQLQVWVDANGDAQTDAGELRSLADLGIASLGLQSQASTEVNNGNAVGLLGSYTTTDGAAHVLADVWLQNQALPVLDLTQVLSDAQTATANLSNGQAELLRLNVSDVLAVQANANGQHVVQITGDSQDVVDLSDLFADGHTTGTWGQNGTVTQNGQTFNVYSYSGDASLQVLIDQHLQHVTLS